VIQTKTDYAQIRYIDSNGREVIRIENLNGKTSIVADNQLQDKSSTDYFIKTKTLKTGETYLSEINLNRERGKITSPHQAVLRTATPVRNRLNESFNGMVIINAEIGNELANIQSAIQDRGRNIYISNDNGY